MKQTTLWDFFKHRRLSITFFATVLFSLLGIQNSIAMIECETLTATNDDLALIPGITVSFTYPQCVCVGDSFQVLGLIEVDDDYTGSPFDLRDIAPTNLPGNTSPGLATSIIIPPGCQLNPAVPGSTYSVAPVQFCGPGTSGQGFLTVPSNGLAEGIPYTFCYTVTATVAGIQTWRPQYSGPLACLELFKIAILVTNRADVPNQTLATGCENTPVTGTLPAPTTGATGPFYYSVGSPTGGSVVLNDVVSGTFTFTPGGGFTGTASFQYNVNPTGPGLQRFCPDNPSGVITIPLADGPNAVDATIEGCAGGGITGTLTAFVSEGSGTYTFSLAGGPSCGTVTINPNGDFAFTGPTGAPSCIFVYEATDVVAPNCSDTGAITVDLNDPPIADAQTIDTCINQSVSGTLTGTGGSGTYVSFAIVTPPTNGLITFFDPSTGDFTYTPNPGFTGTDSFTFTVTDSNGCISAPGTITINVNPIPITSSTSIVGCQNTSLTGNLVPLVTGGTGTQVFAQAGPAPACAGVFVNDNGDFIFAPNFGFTGNCSFQFSVVQGGCTGTGPNTVTVNVQPAPTATGGATAVCAGGTVTDDLNNYVISATGDLSFTGGPGFGGTLNLNPSGPFTFMTTISSGQAGFNWQVMSSLQSCPSALQTYRITVNPEPNVVTGQAAGCSGAAVSGNLLFNVPGATPPLTFSVGGSVVNGMVVVNPNGSFTFTANPGATNGSFTFNVTDGNGCTGAGTELIVIRPSPVVSDSSGVVCSNETLTGDLAPFVTGGTPPYLFFPGGPAAGGSVMIGFTGPFEFTPNPGATAGNFIFQVTDAGACSDTGLFSVAINQAPIASSGSFSGCGGFAITGSLVPLVTGPNPPFTFSGPIGTPENGNVIVEPDGDFIFVPTIPEGEGSFNFNATDSSVPPCTSNVAEVTIIINEGPLALPAFFTGCQDTPFMSTLTPFVSGGLPPFTFSQAPPAPACGVVVVLPNGDFTFTPNPAFVGPCTFFWQVADSSPCLSNIAPATVNVGDNPVASNAGPFPACAGTGNAFMGDLNTFVAGGIPPYSFTGFNEVNGTLNLQPTGPFAFTPILIGPASFDYRATDSGGCLSNTATISFIAQESPIVAGPTPLNTCLSSPVSSFVIATGGTPPYTAASIIATVNGTAVIDSFNNITGVVNFTFTPDPLLPFVTPTELGSVTIQVEDTNPVTGGCFGQTTIDIIIHQNPIASDTGLTACTGTIMGSLVPLVTGGMPPFIFGETGPISPSGCGTVIITPTGDFTFTSPTGFSGPCTFLYQVTESSISACSDTGAVTVNVSIPAFATGADLCSCANAPFTSSLALFISGGVPPFTFSIIGGVCVNLGPQIVDCTIVGGRVILNTQTGQFTFIPNAGFVGITSFMFQVLDSAGCASNIGTVTISVPCCPLLISA